MKIIHISQVKKNEDPPRPNLTIHILSWGKWDCINKIIQTGELHVFLLNHFRPFAERF